MTSQEQQHSPINEALRADNSGDVVGDIQEQAVSNSDIQEPHSNDCKDGVVATAAQHNLQRALQLNRELKELFRGYYNRLSTASVSEEISLLSPHFLPQDDEFAQLVKNAGVSFTIPDYDLDRLRRDLRHIPAGLEEVLGFLAYQGDVFLEKYGERFEAARTHCRESYPTNLAAIKERKLDAEQNAETCTSLLEQLARHGSRKEVARQIVELYPGFKPSLMAKVVNLEAASLFSRLRNGKARAQAWQEVATALESKRSRHQSEAVKAYGERDELSPNLTEPMARRYFEHEVERMLDESRGDLSKLCVLAHQLRAAQALVGFSQVHRAWVNTALECAAVVKNPQAVGAPIKDALSEQAQAVVEHRINREKIEAERDRLREVASPKTTHEVQAFLESSAEVTVRIKALREEEQNAWRKFGYQKCGEARQQIWRAAVLRTDERNHNTVSMTADLAGYLDQVLTSYEAASAKLSEDAIKYLTHFIARCQDRILDHLRELFEAPQSTDTKMRQEFLAAGGAVVCLNLRLYDPRTYGWTSSNDMLESLAQRVASELPGLTFLPRSVREGFEWSYNGSYRYSHGWRDEARVSTTLKHRSVWIPCPDAVDSQLLLGLAELLEKRTGRDLSSEVKDSLTVLVSLKKVSLGED